MDLVPLKKSKLTRAQFEQLSDVPPEDECHHLGIANPSRGVR
jgi:hypothetical protein